MPKHTLPIAVCIGTDQDTNNEIFRIVELTPEQLQTFVQGQVNRLTYAEGDRLPSPLDKGEVIGDGMTGDKLKEGGIALKGRYC